MIGPFAIHQRVTVIAPPSVRHIYPPENGYISDHFPKQEAYAVVLDKAWKEGNCIDNEVAYFYDEISAEVVE